MNQQNNQGLPEVKEYSAGVVVFRHQGTQRRYLLLHYPSGHFDFPKGHLEAGETEIQAALRELEEETGISDVKLIDGFQDHVIYFFRSRGDLINKKVTFFVGITPDFNVKLSDEHQGYLWLDYEAAMAKITFDNSREILRKAEQFMINNSQKNENQL